MLPRSRASAIPRELACPGSPKVIERVGARAGDEGDEGAWLHWQIALRAVAELGATPPDGGLAAPRLSASFKTPKHSLWIIDWAIRHIRETIPSDWTLLVEPELEADFSRWGLTGHCDVLAISPDGKQFIVIDWKLGYLVVIPAEDNDQVLSYAVLAKLNWPSLESGRADLCQPRLSDDEDVPRVSTVEFAPGELDACVASLDVRKCAALDTPRRLVAGPQCKWCVGLKCPALRAELDFMELTLTDEMLDTLKAEPDDAQLSALFLSARTLAKPLDDLDKIVNERLEKGAMACADGRVVTLETQNAGIKVTDPVAFGRQLAEVIPDEDQRAQCVNFVMGRTIDMIAETTGVPKSGKSGNSARDIFNARFSPFYELRYKKVKKVSV